MKSTFIICIAILSGALSAAAQSAPSAPDAPSGTPAALQAAPSPSPADQAPAIQVPASIPGQMIRAGEQASLLPDSVRILTAFQPSDAKFSVDQLMDILRDKRHEGWVLAAYPDPKTGQPLIGAGFSLDLPERVHIQRDPLNSHPFLEPSSAELWQAAGLDPARLNEILAQFHERLDAWSQKGFRRQLWSLDPQITNADADALLRIGIIQAIDNAKAYCRGFDQLSQSQQMAMAQLVYQMGVNLEEFSTFLTLLNRDSGNNPQEAALAKADAQYWHSVQLSLVQSQWARLYRERAKAVIAMLDPNYEVNPAGAERSISKSLPSLRKHRTRSAGVRNASYTHHHSSAAHKRTARTRKN